MARTARRLRALPLAAFGLLLAAAFAGPAIAGTFGRPVIIGGQAADLALDERRGVLYVANFTGNRIEVMSTATGTIQTSFNVAPQPGSLSLSPDGRYLLIAHYGNFAAPNQPRNALTLIDLDSNQRQTFSLSSVPLSVAFGSDGNALVVTSNAFLIFNPLTGTTVTLTTINDLSLKTLPVPFNNFPQNVVASSSQSTRDFTRIYGVVQAGTNDSDVLVYRYDVGRSLIAGGRVSSPPLAPRTISTNTFGTNVLVGWALLNENFVNVAQFPGPSGVLNIGGHVFDTARGLIYAQMNEVPSAATGTGTGGTGTGGTGTGGTGTGVINFDQPKILQILEADNLTVRDRMQLPENLTGKALLSADGNTVYASSESGVLILPVGEMANQRKVIPSVQDLVFRGNFCDRRVASQQFIISDLSGKNSDFVIRNVPAGVSVEPISGITPAVITVTVDPLFFSNTRGTVSRNLEITSTDSVFVNTQVRLLINSREPDQRGTSVNVPGRLVDILSDPVRDRFFILRQDTNSVLVFDGTTYQQIATLRTGNTPMQMAISFDRRFLLVGNDNSQVISVFSLDTLAPQPSIQMPSGHYPRSVASGAGTTLVASRVAGPEHKISRVDFASRTATELPTLDVFQNNININTVLLASPNGAKIVGASADGTTLLFDGNSNSFVTSRKDVPTLLGTYAAAAFDQFVVGNFILNGSLVPIRRLAPDTQLTHGFAFADNTGFRLTSQGVDGPGSLQRVAFPSGTAQIGTRLIESPLLSSPTQPFLRTVAPLFSRNNIVLLTISGFTVVPWNYDAATVAPKISRVTNLADGATSIAPGSLVKIQGTDLSPVRQATSERPLPTALGESCITVNGLPIPLILVSNTEINAQIPFEITGTATLILRTPGGVSDNFNLQVAPTAPSVFRAMVAGLDSPVPTIVNGRNGLLVTGSNPVKRGDSIVIYLTGMGKTNPPVDSGIAAPSNPLAKTISEPTVLLGGRELPVVYAGLTPGEVGVYQINANIPFDVPTGFSIPLVINQGGVLTNLEVRVIN
jgi:uncharacterized protein (TIGR03437 family)